MTSSTAVQPSKSSRLRRHRLRQKTIVGIDWTGSAVAVVEMVERRGELLLKNRFYAEWPVEISLLANPKGAGAWLRKQLKLHGIDAGDVIIALPRRDAALRLVELPSASEPELASMVRFQVVARSGVAVDDLHLDFLPQPACGNPVTTQALTVTFPRSSLSVIQAVIKAAGLRVKACGIGELALSALDHEPPADNTSAFVLANRKKLEFVLVRNGLPISSHAAPIKHARADAVKAPAQINRMLQGLPDPFRASPVTRVNLLGPNARMLYASFVEYLDVPVRIIETPCPDSVRLFALASSLNHKHLRLDFLNARGAGTGKKTRSLASRLIVAGLFFTLCAGAAWSWQLRDQDHQIAALQTQQNHLERKIRQEEHVLRAFRQLQQWETTKAEWTTIWSDFIQHFPKNQQAYLTRLSWTQKANSAPLIQVGGQARHVDTVLKLQNELVYHDFELKPQVIRHLDDPTYPTQFTIRALRKEGAE